MERLLSPVTVATLAAAADLSGLSHSPGTTPNLTCRGRLTRCSRNAESLSLASSVSLSLLLAVGRGVGLVASGSPLTSLSLFRPLFLADSPGAESGGAEARRARSTFGGTALAERRGHVCTCCTAELTMAAASLSERRGGSFLSVRLRCAPHGALRVAIRAGAQDSNLATLYA